MVQSLLELVVEQAVVRADVVQAPNLAGVPTIGRSTPHTSFVGSLVPAVIALAKVTSILMLTVALLYRATAEKGVLGSTVATFSFNAFSVMVFRRAASLA